MMACLKCHEVELAFRCYAVQLQMGTKVGPARA